MSSPSRSATNATSTMFSHTVSDEFAAALDAPLPVDVGACHRLIVRLRDILRASHDSLHRTEDMLQLTADNVHSVQEIALNEGVRRFNGLAAAHRGHLIDARYRRNIETLSTLFDVPPRAVVDIVVRTTLSGLRAGRSYSPPRPGRGPALS